MLRFAQFAFLTACLGLTAIGFVNRPAHPGGTFWEQQRTLVVVDRNPGLREAVDAIEYGETPLSVLTDRFDAHEVEKIGAGVDAYAFEQRHVTRHERKVLGLITVGSGSSSRRFKARLFVRDGVIVKSP